MLIKPLEVSEQERPVLLHRPAQRDAILVALKSRSGVGIEEIACVHVVVAEELVNRPMNLITAPTSHDHYLRSGPLAVFGAVGIAQEVELRHRVDAQKLLAGPARLHVV